jgi:hypothetical protein
MKRLLMVTIALLAMVQLSIAGGWKADKGLDKMSITGELVCVGCSLKKLSGANAQCNLFAHHALGLKTADGSYWSIIDNAVGHDVIRGHKILKGKNATISGWLYPIANMVEFDTISIDGISTKALEQAGWDEDQDIAKKLLARQVGEAPVAVGSHH